MSTYYRELLREWHFGHGPYKHRLLFEVGEHQTEWGKLCVSVHLPPKPCFPVLRNGSTIMRPFCQLVLLTRAINWSKHLETLKRQRLKFHIVHFQCLVSSGGSIFRLSVFNPNLDLTSLAENYSSLCEKSTENGWHTLLMHVSRKMRWLMHVAILCLFSWNSHSLPKDTLSTYHLILSNL